MGAMQVSRILALGTFTLCLFMGIATAQQVTLTARGGTLSIEGRLLSHTDRHYRVDTVYGPITVEAARVTCTGACPDLAAWMPRLRIAGPPDAVRVLLPALWEAYALRHGLTLSLSDSALRLADATSGLTVAELTLTPASATGAQDLQRAGEVDYAVTLGDTGEADGQTRPPRVIALDALVPIVSRANRRRDLTVDALRAILAGEIVDWNALGDPPGPIRIHLLAGLALPFPVLSSLPADATRHSDAASLSQAVARDRFALGLTRFSGQGPARALPLSGACGRTIAANATTLKAEDYPLTLPLVLYGPRGREAEIATDFFEWAATPAGARVIRRAGSISPRYAEVPLSDQGIRLANAIDAAGADVSLGDLQAMLKALDRARRLTATFRFREGSATLDAQSRANVTQLAGAMASGAFEGRTILVVGFTDGEGPAAINRKLARDRAETVRNALLEALPDGLPPDLTIEALGFGEALPMACDDTEWGRQVNRRVEMWVR